VEVKVGVLIVTAGVKPGSAAQACPSVRPAGQIVRIIKPMTQVMLCLCMVMGNGFPRTYKKKYGKIPI
jgi:hypothetical protein